MANEVSWGQPWPTRRGPKPTLRYTELAHKLLQQIATTGMQPGERLGTEDELAHKHSVSRVTVRAALSLLERDGYIDRKRALGTFIKRAAQSATAPGANRGTVVFVYHSAEPSHPYENLGFMTMLRAIERVLRSEHLNLQIVGVESDNAINRKRLHELATHPDVLGFCFVPIWSVSLDVYEEYRSWLPRNIPSVVCNGYDLGTPTCVARAMGTGCRQLMDLLLDNGHRNIALLSSPIFSLQEYRIHARSYVEAFEARGLPVERSLLYKGYPGESLNDFVKGALTGRITPTAVFATEARTCETVFAVARELDLRVPEDLSLVGYGDNVLHIQSPVPVTAYAVQNDSLAENAARLLLDMIQGRASATQSLVVPGRLVEGATVRKL
jgi:GntR family transcriptional regulator of arabinose operon